MENPLSEIPSHQPLCGCRHELHLRPTRRFSIQQYQRRQLPLPAFLCSFRSWLQRTCNGHPHSFTVFSAGNRRSESRPPPLDEKPSISYIDFIQIARACFCAVLSLLCRVSLLKFCGSYFWSDSWCKVCISTFTSQKRAVKYLSTTKKDITQPIVSRSRRLHTAHAE
jgi:hypothetical protein